MIVTPAALPASIPSPSQGEWDIGPFELRAYALCIMAGILLAVWVGSKRWQARGGEPGVVADVAVWAVPFGIIGGRLYHVITDYQLYFGEGRDPWRALQIWQGGLGIWGAIAMGALGVWIACRRRGVPMTAMADTLAPAVLLAQAVGRWGNWFNQELFGRPTDLPWALEIDPDRRPAGYEDAATFHPTFLYESLWAVFIALLLIWLDRRFRLGHGRVFALYVAGYTLGRGFWEYLRIDPANEIFGLRVNLWVSGLVFLAAVGYFVWSARTRPGRESPEDLRGFYEDVDPFAESGSRDREDGAPFTLPEDRDLSEDGDAETKKAETKEAEVKGAEGEGAERGSDEKTSTGATAVVPEASNDATPAAETSADPGQPSAPQEGEPDPAEEDATTEDTAATEVTAAKHAEGEQPDVAAEGDAPAEGDGEKSIDGEIADEATKRDVADSADGTSSVGNKSDAGRGSGVDAS